MPERLTLTQNAQFYKINDTLTDDKLGVLLDAASENKIPNTKFVINEVGQNRLFDHDSSYKYSLRIFQTNRTVYFWEEPLQDLIYAYILIVQIDDYVAILKKSCANINDIVEQLLTIIKSTELTNSFDDERVEYQKMSMRNMTLSERAIRARSYEANDLKGLLSMHAAGRSIPYFLKLRMEGVTKSISVQSGRIAEPSERKSLDDIVRWVSKQIAFIKNPPSSQNFLNAFAEEIDIDSVWSRIEPTAILIESSFIEEQLISKEIPLFYKFRKSKKLVKLKDKHLRFLLTQLEKVYEIDVANDFCLSDAYSKSKLRKNKRTISLNSSILQRIKMDEKGRNITLQSFINKNHLLAITFSEPNIMYYMGKCFKDGSGINEIPSILSSMIILEELQNATSEKGKITEKKKRFEPKSVFRMVEDHFASSDYIFCDDLGDEWADHIIFNIDTFSVTFVHSKHDTVSNSASKLHDVVGQALKNIGNMDIESQAFMKKYENKLNLNYTGSSIPRKRTKRNEIFEDYLTELRKDYRFSKNCIICCSFLSRGEIEEKFLKLQAGEKVRGQITQIFWILSSFIHASREAGVSPVVFCAP